MNPILKRMLFIVTMILFFVSIGHDLTTGTFPKELVSKAEDQEAQENQESTKSSDPSIEQERFRVIEHRVKAGDTVLSIMEKINKDGPPVTIEQMLADFESINKGQDPNTIKMNEIYLFPYYHKNEKH
ncbi:hypothetical protein N780_05095 [Pontibacillus chungwhensis BH030062]|uniref:LysM domain-containing protein n=1 Tax=Pontibacillus chungwhensis BH030062 TaxID=1385513 RepID=A0A0A2URF5_9BACI|nr:hypothetical protein [Pontibacillus chungwhensis]KGP90519.1 hypothetical protein N780_05095 [Pontibacillus chungwhensis BH030062]